MNMGCCGIIVLGVNLHTDSPSSLQKPLQYHNYNNNDNSINYYLLTIYNMLDLTKCFTHISSFNSLNTVRQVWSSLSNNMKKLRLGKIQQPG